LRVSDLSVFEQPLTERIRALLRLQLLFERIDFHVARESIWNTHAAVTALLEVVAFTTRSDVKSEVMKELDRQSGALRQLHGMPHVDGAQLTALLAQHKELVNQLHAQKGQLGQHLANHEFLKSVRQRSNLSSSPVSFDLPSYHQWLRMPAKERYETMSAWLEPFATARTAVNSALDVIRGSGEFQDVTATNGYFEQTLNTDKPIQLLRMTLSPDLGMYPETSAGKHRFTIRFIKQPSPDHKGTQEKEDIAFRLACCGV
jgi:cell division protein ZapD